MECPSPRELAPRRDAIQRCTCTTRTVGEVLHGLHSRRRIKAAQLARTRDGSLRAVFVLRSWCKRADSAKSFTICWKQMASDCCNSAAEVNHVFFCCHECALNAPQHTRRQRPWRTHFSRNLLHPTQRGHHCATKPTIDCHAAWLRGVCITLTHQDQQHT